MCIFDSLVYFPRTISDYHVGQQVREQMMIMDKDR